VAEGVRQVLNPEKDEEAHVQGHSEQNHVPQPAAVRGSSDSELVSARADASARHAAVGRGPTRGALQIPSPSQWKLFLRARPPSKTLPGHCRAFWPGPGDLFTGRRLSQQRPAQSAVSPVPDGALLGM